MRKKIGLLCLMVFVHGCCCPSSGQEDTKMALILDQDRHPILFPLHNINSGNQPIINDLKKLEESIALHQRIVKQDNDRFFVGMTKSLLPVIVEKGQENRYHPIGDDNPVQHVKNLMSQNYSLFCQTLLFGLIEIGPAIHPCIRIRESSKFDLWKHDATIQTPNEVHTLKIGFLAPKGHGGFFIPLELNLEFFDSLEHLLFDQHVAPKDPKKIKYTTFEDVNYYDLLDLSTSSLDPRKIARGIMFTCHSSQIKTVVVTLEQNEGSSTILFTDDIPPILDLLVCKIIFGDDDTVTYFD